MTMRVAIIVSLFCAQAHAQTDMTQGELLSETPIWPIPQEMTIEEYTDANRRLSVGLLLMSVPLPGSLHFYAGERRAGWKHVGAAALGLTSIVAGAALIDEKDSWEKSDFETTDIVGQSGKVTRYEKVPVGEENGAMVYRYDKLGRKEEGGGGALIVLGAGLLVGQFIHDLVGGIKTIERKRDAVRFKYGKRMGLSLDIQPNIDVTRGQLGAQLSLRF